MRRMGTTMLSLYLISLVLGVRGAAIRSMHLRCMDSERDCGKCNYILCAVKALQFSDGQRDLSGKLLDTRSCSLVAIKARHLRTNLWEIYAFHELQDESLATDQTTTVSSWPTRGFIQTERQEKELFILTLNVGFQVIDLHIPKHNHYSNISMKGNGGVDFIDAVFCPGNGKPLKLVYEGSKIYSYTFPSIDKRHISAVRDILNGSLNFLRCDSNSGVTLLISDDKIFNGTWERKEPDVALLTVAKRRIMAASVDMNNRMLYWTQESPGDRDGGNVDLYRINYSGHKEKKEKVTTLEEISSFVVDHARQHIYACKVQVIRFNMKGQRVRKKSDVVKINYGCTNLALYGQGLYMLGNRREANWFKLNVNSSTTAEFHLTNWCSMKCVIQVFETLVPSKYLHHKA